MVEVFKHEKMAHKKTEVELTQLKLGLVEKKKAMEKRELGFLSKQNFAQAEVMGLQLKVDKLEKMLRNTDKVTEMNQRKLIKMRIHMGKKQYYKSSENDPPLSPSTYQDLYTCFDVSTDEEVIGLDHDLSEMRSFSLA